MNLFKSPSRRFPAGRYFCRVWIVLGNPGPPRGPVPKIGHPISTDSGDPSSPNAGPYHSRRCLRLGFSYLLILLGYMLDTILNLDTDN